MKTSELIARLQALLAEFGDLEVRFKDVEDYQSMGTETPGYLPIQDVNLSANDEQLVAFVSIG